MRRRTTPVLTALLGLALMCVTPFLARAQEAEDVAQPDYPRLVNLDTPTLPAPGATTYLADVRVFGAQEDTLYGTLQVGHGLSDSLMVMLRGSFADIKTFAGPGFDIRHGGTDVELLGRWRPANEPHWGVEAGIAWANTPAQNDAFVTAQFVYQRPVGSRLVLHFVPKAVFVKDDPIVGIGGGFTARLSDTLAIVGDLTGIVSGNNTRSIITGDKRRSEVWGAALRWRPRSERMDCTVDVGVTNGTGGTTGFSLTPGLSGSAAFTISVTLRR